MKKILSLILVAVMALTLMTPAVTASAESVNSYSVLQSEVQSDDSSGGSFQVVVDFFRSLFFSRITFDTDGGSEIDDYYKLKFSRISSPADPTKEGYTFEGWEPAVPSRMPWSNLTVKAKWQATEHNVYWVIDGETAKTETYAYGDTITAYVPSSKEGYTFSGWFSIPESMPDDDVIISGTYTKDTEIVVAESDEEFSNKVMELVSESLNDENFDKEAALEDEFYMRRVIANCNDFSSLDFSIFNADTVVMNSDGTVVLQFANRDLAEECSDYLNGLSSVTFAEADVYIEAPEDVDIEKIESASNSIWGEKYINADKYAHYIENNNLNKMITVAVIDTGIDMDHPYFNGRLASGKNVFTRTSNVEDDTGHGTHVSGIIVNCTNNLNVKIMPIRALSAEGGSYNSIVEGINHAVSQKVQVINLSLEGPYSKDSFYLENAINHAISKGIIVVVAAGNGDKTTRLPVNTANVTPASMDNVIVVGALDETGTKGSFSNYGDSVDVIAPGVAVPSTYLDGKYALMSGTSQATPHIAAVAAMFKLAYPDYTPAQIEALIKQYCVDKGPSGRDDFYGEGCPDMYNAIPDCTVSFDTNGGTAINSATTKNSSSVTLPTPSKSYKVTFNANGGTLNTSYTYSNCSFDGWYTSSSLNGQKYSADESYMLLKNQTMYAKWINGQLGKINKPTRSCYSFAGWWTLPEGGTEYSSSTRISDNITLYAHWDLNPVSDWTTESSVPAGTTIVEQATQYRYQDYQTTSSPNSTLSGWTYDRAERTGWGGTVGPVYSNPANGSRNVWSEQYVVSSNYKTVYRYWRYCKNEAGTGGGQKTYSSTYKYRKEYVFDSKLTLKYTGDNSGGYKYYYNSSNPNVASGNYYVVWLVGEEQQWVSDNYGTRWYYQEPIYTYYFYRWSNWSDWSFTAVSASSTRKVETRQMCKYRYNADLGTY